MSHEFHIHNSKLTCPSRGSVIERARLVPLYKGLLTHRLTLVSAGAGYGKTTFVSQALAGTTASTVWYSLDQSDRDLSVFLNYILQGLSGIIPGFNSQAKTIYPMLWDNTLQEVVETALSQGISQVVVLGAGYDTRAFRLKAVKKAIVFELDHPATQKIKKEKVTGIFNDLPDHVRYIAIDFESENLEETLKANGYDETKPALFIMEGIIMYLTPEKVDQILSFIREKTSPGSALAFDYLPESLVDGSIDAKEGKRMYKHVNQRGEPFQFGLNRDRTASFLSDHGFEVVRHLPAPECRKLYFKDKGRKRKISDIFSFVHARTA